MNAQKKYIKWNDESRVTVFTRRDITKTLQITNFNWCSSYQIQSSSFAVIHIYTANSKRFYFRPELKGSVKFERVVQH